MPGYTQAGLATAPQPEHDNMPDKVYVPRVELLSLATTWWNEPGRRGDASFIRAGCIGQGDLVPMTRSLAEAWGLVQ